MRPLSRGACKAHYVVVHGILGYGVILAAFTFLWEHGRNLTRLGLPQVFLDLPVRTPLCLVAGYLFGFLTWKWFGRRYGPTNDLDR